MFGFKKKSESVQDVLLRQKRELQIELDSIRLELANERRRQAMVVEEEAHKHKLVLKAKEEEFARSQKHWVEDKERILAGLKADKDAFEQKLVAEYSLKEKEAIGLLKLDAEQRIKRAELELQAKLNDELVKHQKDLSTKEQTLNHDYYEKLSQALTDLNSKGNVTTEFITSLALKMMDKVPMLNTQTNKTELRTIAGARE